MPDGVQIDTGRVSEFAKDMRTEADTGFASAASRGSDLHGHGVVFGAAIAGDAVLQAKTRYARVLERVDANMRAYRIAADILADVSEMIAHDFSAADLASERGQSQVQTMMSDAIAKANAVLTSGTSTGGEF